MRRGFAVLFAVAAAMALPQTAFSAGVRSYFSYSVPLVVNEALPGFTLPQSKITVPRGFAKFTTIVPKSATGRHGVGIDGGPYKDILGMPVRPGASSSLTVDLPAGDYTVFDSYKKNRAAGYTVKVHVTHARAKHASYGRLCPDSSGFGIEAMWVKNVSCRSAKKISDEVDAKWDAGDFVYTPIVEGQFTCYISPFSAIGMKTSCLSADARFTYAG